MRSWSLKSDMNGDGVTTISDVSAWMGWLFFYPGDIIFALALNSPGLAQFLEISPAIYGGWLSGILSALVWFFAFVMCCGIAVSIEEGRSEGDDQR